MALKIKTILNPGRQTLRAYTDGAEAILRVNRTSVSTTMKLDNDVTPENRNLVLTALGEIVKLYEDNRAAGISDNENLMKINDELGGKPVLDPDGTFPVPFKGRLSPDLVEALGEQKQTAELSEGVFTLKSEGYTQTITADEDATLIQKDTGAWTIVDGKGEEVAQD